MKRAQSKIKLAATIVVSTGLFVACSGGSEGSSPTPPATPTNRAPVLTSATSLNVAENTTGTIYTATATDADGDTLSFAISGVDASLFSLSSTSGALAFLTAPDFETPTDADTDNSYELTLTVSDPGGLQDSLSLSITVTDATESGQRYLDPIFAAVDVTRDVTFAPGLLMDIYTPAGDSVTDRPVLIAASGGGFVDQDRESVEPIAEAFARRGYVAVTMDYRVLGGLPLSADALAIAGIQATHDMFAAVRFMRAEAEATNPYGTRTDAIFVTGESAGGVMAAIAATLDPSDAITSSAVSDYLAANGGVYGTVGTHLTAASAVNGALPLSGAILDLATIDAGSAVMYAAHEEFDPVVPCDTNTEGASFTGLTVSGACEIVPAYTAAGATAELFLVAGSVGHVEFSQAERDEIYSGAASLFFTTVISP